MKLSKGRLFYLRISIRLLNKGTRAALYLREPVEGHAVNDDSLSTSCLREFIYLPKIEVYGAGTMAYGSSCCPFIGKFCPPTNPLEALRYVGKLEALG